ncbi:helix-turn-helix transcriptional regulator [Nocardiopsis sp. FIRDI 009]|uniref:helix-turn-helix domain-containing protein n=1 Tax=Nocardiopsis sp. FIRDI 009 TaxID=714197 RepID=UPI000E26DAFD|nr:helix-turn-helix transcriptional regulator [Nocardiopsis sp. FIRDI 009]
MATRYSPTIRRRRLSAELRRVRQAARMTSEEVAKAAELSKSTYSNIESGAKQRPKLPEIRAILDACKVPYGQEYEEILDLCRQALERGWWNRYRDVLAARYVGFETEANSLSTWEPVVLPGLLQVPSYMEVTAQASLAQPEDVRRVVDARMTRQRILEDEDPPELWAIFDETALLRLEQHPRVRQEQIAHLLAMAERPNITLQMTRANQLNAGSGGPFVILEFPEPVDPTIVYLETDTDGIYLEEPDEIARYRNLMNHLRLAALRPGETADHLRQMIE